ncbi:MAG: hypothetical protein IIA44_09005 [Acidobacteria bacterium]|nr:hypothetical protein [Acidobacteriota bacterium]
MLLIGLTFDPSDVIVAPGDTLEWHWFDGAHTATSGSPSRGHCTPDGRFVRALDAANPVATYTVPDDEPSGVIPYFSAPHCDDGMTAGITVVEPCISVADCNDADPCTLDSCDPGHPQAGFDGCVHEYQVKPFGDIVPIFAWEPGAPTQPDLDDIICIVDGFGAGPGWPGVCPDGDQWNTAANACGSDGEINSDDIIVELDAFGGNAACPAPCS